MVVKPLAFVACALDLYPPGLVPGFGEESMFVKGVRLLTFCAVPELGILDCCAGALKTDDTVLECELADPTPFNVSPGNDSLSSARAGGASALQALPSAGRVNPASSFRDMLLYTTCMSAAARDIGDSMVCDLDFTLSFALSLAALGAAGKN